MGMADLSLRYKQEAGRINYVTPTSYLELLQAFTGLLGMKRSTVLTAQQRYEVCGALALVLALALAEV